ncbi:MAG: hypothetical protein BroJett026_27700 [Betaproteobacteria bacterium]|nr:MAG: hypothetical protein BroJett026_27700 [Betaproteobacteria bacterium]
MESQPKPAANESEATAAKNERSTIEFPYTDLDNAVEIVRGVHEVGGTACTYDQLAAQLQAEASGGGFRMRVGGAKTFGLLTYERGGRITLTELGREIADPQSERPARARAFLAVPLYERVFNEYRGRPLPPQAALERALVAFGVGQKVTDKARQVMLRSARQAGYFELSQDRLTSPPIRPGDAGRSPQQEDGGKRDGGSDGGGGGKLHPLIQGLLMTLPEPRTDWAISERQNWLVMANSIFKMIYPTQETGDVEIKKVDGGKEPDKSQ